MRTEKNYEFRKRLDIVHKPGIFDRTKQPQADEIILDGSWEIVYDGLPQKGCAALDLQDYLQVCMGIGIPVVKESSGGKAIILKEELADKGFDLAVTQEKITISGNVRKGVHHLEDVMNLREAPYLPVKTMRSDPIFTPRMVHSGWALDCFPDSHLNAISHAGFDAILLFVTGPNKTSHGYLDFNDLIDRAEAYGLGVYFYSYLNSFKHPDDPDAEEFFDRNFGSVFKCAPRAKGLILVGESCRFPSKDPRNSTQRDGRRSQVGFFPASDYPQWLYLHKGSSTTIIKSKIFFDPAAQYPATVNRANMTTDYGMSYSNGCLLWHNGVSYVMYRRRDFAYPSRVYLMGDTRNRNAGRETNISLMAPTQASETTSPTVACANSTRHRGVLNMLHLDGHVNGYKANMEDSYLDIGTKSTNQIAWGYKKK